MSDVTELAWQIGDNSYSFDPVTKLHHALSTFDPRANMLALQNTRTGCARRFTPPHGLELE